jgi:hypothetical protein
MDQEKSGPKITLWRKPLSTEDSGNWSRLSKALKSFAEIEEIEVETLVPEAQINAALEAGKKVFLDLALAEVDALSKNATKDLILVRNEPFAWNNPQAREALLPLLLAHPCLILEGISATDLLRVLHLYLVPKNQSGVCPLMEKGSLILAEKVQSLDSIGLLLDRFSSYFNQVDGFSLKGRINDFRQLLTGLISEAYQRSTEATNIYPTVEFQASAQAKKLAVHFRFPLGKLDPTQLPSITLNGGSMRWQWLWQSCDFLLLTHHKQHMELEVHALFLSESKTGANRFSSFFCRSLEQSGKSTSAMIAPKDYQFSVFSEIKVLKGSIANNGSKTSDEVQIDGIDLSSVPEEVRNQISKLEHDRGVLKEFAEKKENAYKEASIKLAEVKKEIAQRRAEVSKLIKSQEHSKEVFQRKIAEMEKRIANSQSHAMAQASAKNTAAEASAGNLQEVVSKMEGSLRALEQEKTNLSERLNQEQKRVAMYEQKYAQLFKDTSLKDKEIQDLKASLLKLRKENNADEKKSGTPGAGQSADGSSAKIKEFEQRETVLKQELRKLQFKLDNHDKNLKAQQQEAAEKAKLMEQKLQGAKTRELELLKKIEELSSALKKAAKAA